MGTTVTIDLGDLRERVAAEVYAGVQDAVARVEKDFGPLIAKALGAVRVATEAPTAAAPEPPPVAPAPGSPLAGIDLPGMPDTPLVRRRLKPDEIRNLQEEILGTLRASPWLTVEKLAKRLGVPTNKLVTPLRQLRGIDGRGKPTGETPRIQAVGDKRTTSYALVGTPVATAPKKAKTASR